MLHFEVNRGIVMVDLLTSIIGGNDMKTPRMVIILILSLSLFSFSTFGITSDNNRKAQPNNIIHGKVLSPNGDPIEGALIQGRFMSGRSYIHGYIVKTDSNGLFDWIRSNHEAYFLVATHPSYPQYKALWIERSFNEPFALLVLKKMIDLQGLITDKEKTPIKDAKIELLIGGVYTQTGYTYYEDAVTTDTTGKFIFKDLVPGFEYKEIINAKDYIEIEKSLMIAEGTIIPSTRHLSWIPMERAYSIPFTITDNTGKPIVDARILANGRGLKYRYEKRTNNEGKVIIDNLPLGEINVSVYYQGKGQDESYIVKDPKEIIKIIWEK
jgi:hypothetical protein